VGRTRLFNWCVGWRACPPPSRGVPPAAVRRLRELTSPALRGCRRREDQQRLQGFIDSASAGGAGATKEAKAAAKAAGVGQFDVSYALSSRSVCKGCLKFILKGDVRPPPRRGGDTREWLR
jgi:hypothetical protein